MRYETFIEADGELGRQITFLSRVLRKNGDFDYTSNILIEKSEIEEGKFRGVACDNYRLHIVDPLFMLSPEVGLAEGYWRSLKSGGATAWIVKCDQSYRFPNFRAVMPKVDPLFTFRLPGLPRGDISRNTDFLVKFFREFPEPTALNMRYLNALDHNREWTVKWYGVKKPILFESDDYTALISQSLIRPEEGE
jgi:hypothetical protein